MVVKERVDEAGDVRTDGGWSVKVPSKRDERGESNGQARMVMVNDMEPM